MALPYALVGAAEVMGLRIPNQADAAFVMITVFPFFAGMAAFVSAQVGRRWREAGADGAELTAVASQLPGRGVQAAWMIASMVTGIGIAWMFRVQLAGNAVAVSAWLGLGWLALSHGWVGGPAESASEDPASTEPGDDPPGTKANSGIGRTVGGGIVVGLGAWLLAVVLLIATDGFGLYDHLGLVPVVFSPAILAAGLTWIFYWQGVRRRKFAPNALQVGGIAGTAVALACSGLMVFPLLTVRRTSQDKAVLSNARQLSAAADQYYLENGGTRVAYSELVGATNYIKALNTVAGENYPQYYTQGMTITVTEIAGARTVTYAP
ncbi:MAG TPA: hypothetical protein VG734_22105 [Lacunisphaera sp.]|nr:hypothetical protein [Lacunisphaera sp.]